MRPARRSFVFALGASALFAASMVAPALAASGTTVYVDDDGHGSATSCSGSSSIPSSIASVAASAAANTTIMVCPGRYVGDVAVSNVSGVRIVAVKRWTATIVAPPDQSSGSPLVYALYAPNFELYGMRVVAPTTGTCGHVGAMVAINVSPNSRVYSNHILPEGTDTLGGCGYQRGVAVLGGSDGTFVFWNRIKDFIQDAVDMDSVNNVRIRKNTITYAHAASSSTASGGIGILLNQNGTGDVLANNQIRGIASGGTSTPRFDTAIEDITLPARISFNRISYVNVGITLLSNTGGLINANIVKPNVGSGISLLVNSNVTVVDNTVEAYNSGMYVTTSSLNNIHDNNFGDSATFDCYDDSSGTHSDGTDNFWNNNIGLVSSPTGLCSAPV